MSLPHKHIVRFWFVLHSSFLCLFLLTDIAHAAIWPFSLFWKEEKEAQYNVAFKGIDDKKLVTLLENVSETVKKNTELPQTSGLLHKRTQDDQQNLQKALRSQGYYGASIRTEIHDQIKPPEVMFIIDKGGVFTIQEKEITLSPDTPSVSLPDVKELTPQIGKTAEAKPILDSVAELEDTIQKKNCLVFVKIEPEVTVDHATHGVYINYHVRTGPSASFGHTTITGLASVQEAVAQRLLKWQQGKCFDRSLLENTRINIIQSALFANARITPASQPDENGELPIAMEITERKHRTIKGGVGYTSDEGASINGSWEHRNIFHGGESLEANATVSQIAEKAGISFTKPAFLREDQTLKLGTLLSNELTEAFDSRKLTFSALVDRQITERITAGTGVSYGISQVKEDGELNNFALISIPTFIARDTRNDILDPTKGHTLRAEAAPFFDTLGADTGFFRSQLRGSTYFHADTRLSPTLALRGTIGSISGTVTSDIPADERFYAGGGNSVRGYAFQKLGQLDDGDPAGGRSLLELSAEVRLRIKENVGWVVFMDAGNAYDKAYPNFEDGIRKGAGMGVRYFTGFGPLRFDVAVPLDKRKGIDDPYQIYISLGQAF